jgi:hypothetical protein
MKTAYQRPHAEFLGLCDLVGPSRRLAAGGQRGRLPQRHPSRRAHAVHALRVTAKRQSGSSRSSEPLTTRRSPHSPLDTVRGWQEALAQSIHLARQDLEADLPRLHGYD